MAQVEHDDPIDPPSPAAAPANTLQATVAALQTEVAALRAELAARNAPIWMPLKPAAGSIPMPYENARSWAERAIEAGRLDEAIKPAGRVIVNVTALAAYHMTMTKK